jgi:hypothetical protein
MNKSIDACLGECTTSALVSFCLLVEIAVSIAIMESTSALSGLLLALQVGS